MSYGGLTKPTDEVLRWVHNLEEKFLQIHGAEFKIRENVRKELEHSLFSECTDVPNEVVKLFAKTRIYMRCKHLNQKKSKSGFVEESYEEGSFEE